MLNSLCIHYVCGLKEAKNLNVKNMAIVEVDILLSTYNPNVEYLKKLVQSISNQITTYSNTKISINLLWRDDGSKTVDQSLIAGILKNNPYWNLVYKNVSEQNIGFLSSYNELIKNSLSPYAFICDQDDIWENTKLQFFLQKATLDIQKSPQLYFSDLQCIDENDKITKKSFLNHYGYNPDAKNCQFFLKNYIPGCSIMMNGPLRELYNTSLNKIELHDHHLILLAVAFGNINRIDSPEIKYRIHQGNTLGFLYPSLKTKAYLVYQYIKYFFSPWKYVAKTFDKHINELVYIYEEIGAQRVINNLDDYRIFKEYFLLKKTKNSKGLKFCYGIGFIQSALYRKLHWKL